MANQYDAPPLSESSALLPQQATEPTVEAILQQALSRQQAGEFQQASELYLSILQSEPHHAEANHNMGLLAVQMDQPAAALSYFTAALDADPACGPYWLHYIDALFLAGQPEDARQVMSLAQQQGLQGAEVDALAARLQIAAPSTPPEAEAMPKVSPPTSRDAISHTAPHTHGTPSQHEVNTLISLFNAGRLPEAASVAQVMTERFPKHEFGWKALGAIFKQMGRSADALVPMQKAARLSPGDAETHYNLGTTFQELGQVQEAETSYRASLKISPHNAKAFSNLGVLLQEQGRLQEAETCYRQALLATPDSAKAHSNLGALLHKLGRCEEAEVSLRQALQIDRNNAETLCNLGNTLKLVGRTEEAEASYRRALQINPHYADAHFNLGNLLHGSGRLGEAEASYRQAIQIRPDHVDAHCNLGNVLFDQGFLDQAIDSHGQALKYDPKHIKAHSSLLFCLSHSDQMDAETLFEAHLRFGEQFEAPQRDKWPKHENSRNPDHTLQIGFVSGDLKKHAVASFIQPVLEHLAGYPRLSLHAYANHVVDDDTSKALRGHFAYWHPVHALSDDELAAKIRADGIDILIDLSGHTGHNRLLTFARKPAPVQASWMGYPATTGLQAMDYYLSDRFLLPEGKFDSQFTEQIVRLPANAPFMPSPSAPPVNALPALKNGYVTFGSFNRLNKLNRATIAMWSQILRALPASRMLLAGMPEDGNRGALLEWFAHEGITEDRLDFHTRSNMASYLALHHQVDICLDTFPYNGGTTTLHALWMGVPTLSLEGGTMAGRTGAAILGHANLETFVAHDAAEFVHKGWNMARDLAIMSELRAGLRERFANSAMGQPAVIAAGLEQAMRCMWERWCAGLPPASFEIASKTGTTHHEA